MRKDNHSAKGGTSFDQSAVIPYRKKNGEMEVLLVTTIRKKNWIIPKGFIEYHLTPFQSAKKEAYEEAGVRGSNSTKTLGSFKINKYGGDLFVKVFSMKVTRVQKDYPERNLRKRKWFTVRDAADKVDIPDVAKLIRKLGRMNGQRKSK